MSRGKMRKFYSDFLSGETDICPLFLERAKGQTTSRYTLVDDSGTEVMSFWRRNGEIPFIDKKPKGEMTGGKRPYVMVFTQKVEEVTGNVPLSCLGCLFALLPYVEMGTGRLREKRSKKSLTVKGMAERLYISRQSLSTSIKLLMQEGIIVKKSDGYYISRSYLLRGVKRDEEGKTARETTDSEGT